MFAVTVRMAVSSSCGAEGVHTLLELRGNPRAQPGCAGSRILRDVEEKGTIVIQEQWLSAGDLRARLASRSLGDLLALGDRTEQGPEVRIEEVRRVWGMDLLALVRRLEDAPHRTGNEAGEHA